ncbi:hypothetical protein [Nocardia africana]|uniref:hypothetical protein n=1 Tax=Nocardia africana TaxID=134964 RepID=UPI000FE1F3C6|nr:hypothetical protein [Nocardia africana]
MNKITRMTVTAMTVVGALGAGSAIGSAAPTAAADHVLSTEIMPGVQYTSSTADQSVVIETATATLVAAGGQFQVRDASGATVAGVAAFPTEPKALTAVHAAPRCGQRYARRRRNCTWRTSTAIRRPRASMRQSRPPSTNSVWPPASER